MSFVDEDVEQTMFDEFHELQDEAQTQREHAASLLTPEVTDSALHTPNAEQNIEENAEPLQDNLSTTTDLLALHELLENEEPEDEAQSTEVEGSTSSLFDRLMKQDNSIFVTNDNLPKSDSNKDSGGAESKIIRNPLIETQGEVPPWDDIVQSNEQNADVVEPFTAAGLESLEEHVETTDDDEIDFDEADDAPFEKASVASKEEELQSISLESDSQTNDAHNVNQAFTELPPVDGVDQMDDAQRTSEQVGVKQEAPPEYLETEHVDDIYPEERQSTPEKQFVDTADEIAAMFGHGVNDLSNVKITHPQIAPYLENGEKLLRAKQINKWSDFIEELGVGGLNKQLLLQSNLVQHGEHFIIRIDERNKHLDEEQHHATITEALSNFYQKPVTFEVQCGDVDETPFQIQQQISLVRHQHAHKVVETNDSIQELIKAFEGRVIEGSIKPR
ncbi:DNA polymerase III subunit gamma/tau C-terminal domain-containing protein [Brumicola nitratireducens]|uniref:DNA polymerase III subunit gamma/tau C-terminal domain-containing protein n=1 Tax=Brumicola nitratireducens TaxID=300231 RepID=UPI0009FF1689|nr:DNA polymerase III subunit gamma/tau C-terminal domain-containing protein [Glaciecola nitratireducens]